MNKNIEKQKQPFKIKFLSFYAGIKKYIRVNKSKIKKYIQSNNFKIPSKAIFFILLDGLIISLASLHFIPFNSINILVFGCAWYFFKVKIYPIIKGILQSINIIKIGK